MEVITEVFTEAQFTMKKTRQYLTQVSLLLYNFRKCFNVLTKTFGKNVPETKRHKTYKVYQVVFIRIY